MAEAIAEQPLLLVATEGEWAGRSLESLLTDRGYAVLRTQSGLAAIELAHRTKPDALIVDENMHELSGIEVCRRLRHDPTFDASTPIVMIAAAPAAQAERAAAYAAGAWTVCAHPVDAEILLLELATFIRARRAVAHANARSLIDPTTGLLSAAGLDRWAEHLGARAVRNREPLACVVLMAPASNEAAGSEELADIAARFIETSKVHMRRSDIVGVTGDGRLALLAPDTDDAGAIGLVERLRAAIEASANARKADGRTSAEFRAGYCAIPDFSMAAVPPQELLNRASRAVELAGKASNHDLTFSFDSMKLPRDTPLS